MCMELFSALAANNLAALSLALSATDAEARDAHGVPALLHATSPRAAAALLTAGADANADDGGLMEAVFGVDKENKDGKGGENAPRPCCAHLAPDDAYCARVDTVVPALLEVSREIADGAVAAHLNGRRMSKYENFVDPTVVIGGKSTCLLYTSPSPRDS